jgi:hypothetical protein
MKKTSRDATLSDSVPEGYVEKTEGTIAANDLVWDSDDAAFESVQGDPSIVGTPVSDVPKVATPAYWVTFDGTTGIVWGVGESPEESIREAKFEAFGDDHGAVGYEFACWCEEMSTTVCSETLYAEAKESGKLSVSEDDLQQHVVA